jgi:hypothetical protein
MENDEKVRKIMKNQRKILENEENVRKNEGKPMKNQGKVMENKEKVRKPCPRPKKNKIPKTRKTKIPQKIPHPINDGPATAKSTTVVSRPTSAKSPRTPGVTEVGLEMRNR